MTTPPARPQDLQDLIERTLDEVNVQLDPEARKRAVQVLSSKLERYPVAGTRRTAFDWVKDLLVVIGAAVALLSYFIPSPAANVLLVVAVLCVAFGVIRSYRVLRPRLGVGPTIFGLATTLTLAAVAGAAGYLVGHRTSPPPPGASYLPPAGTSYLANLPHVGGAEPDPVSISGTQYSNSVWQFSIAGQAIRDEYNLYGVCQQLKYTAGVTDDSSKSARITFEVYGDGKKLGSHQLAYRQVAVGTVGIAGVRRLSLQNTGVASVPMSAGWGDAEVTCDNTGGTP